MRYELKSKSVGAKIDVFDIINEERNKEGEIIVPESKTKTGDCAYPVQLTLVDTESRNTSTFQESFMAIVSCKLSIEEGDVEVEKQIEQHLNDINK